MVCLCLLSYELYNIIWLKWEWGNRIVYDKEFVGFSIDSLPKRNLFGFVSCAPNAIFQHWADLHVYDQLPKRGKSYVEIVCNIDKYLWISIVVLNTSQISPVVLNIFQIFPVVLNWYYINKTSGGVHRTQTGRYLLIWTRLNSFLIIFLSEANQS